MEVKGEPVLSFFGTLYKNPTKTTNTDEGYVEYTWSATATRQDSDAKGAEKLDLSGIKARVYTDDDGSQTVKFIIPDDLMPTLYPDNYQQFYYEEQPVRLIYQVGLTATAYASATDGDTFYTNLYDSDTGAAGTTVTFTPDGTNEYYTASYQGKTNAKGADANATETSPNCFTESVTVNTKTVTGDDGQETQQPTGEVTVTQTLGNNGKLTVHKTPTLTLTKAWDGVTNTPNNATVYLFQEKTYADGSSDIALFKTYTLSSSNDWSAVQKGMVYAGTDAAKGDYTCQYYVMESLVGYNSYNPTYTDGEGSEIAYVLKDVTVSGAQYNNARLYPVTDSVTITNRPQTFTIQKTWTDDDVGANSIQVNIYRTKTAVQGSSRTSTTELLDTVTLDSDNDWTYTYTDAPAYAFNFTDFKAYYYDYYVEEVPVSGYGATYSYGEGDALLASVLTVSGESVHAYPVTSAITITNTKTVPKVTVTKSWSDSDTVDHSGDSVQVGLYAQIEIAYETEDPGTGQTVTTLVPGYLYKGSATLQADNNWTHTWTLDDIGTTYYAEGSKDTYTVVGYSVAEMSASTSGYAPVYYSVDADGSQTPIALGETSNGQYMIQGDSPKVISENAISLMMLTDLPAKLSYIGGTPLDFYPVKENMVLENVPTNQLTVKKIWAEGTIPEEITVELYPVGLIDGKQIVADDPAALFPDVTWTVTLNEKNNWQYQWTDLPTQVETVDDENNPVTLDFIYCVRETPTAHYQPTYTDGNGQTLQPTLTVANKDHIPAVLRPNDGVVQITNSIRSTDLTLTKKWQGVETADQKTVSVKLYQKLEGQSATVLDTVTLSAANNWTATVEDLPYYKLVDGQFKEYTYYIREVGEEDGSDYSVTYTDAVSGDKLTKTVLAEGLYGYSINLPADTSADPASVLITNAAYYALPHTGGIGTQWYTLSGMAILITAIALYALMTTRQRNRRKGGEG
jgi:LPXTG-motif cell wall-anchored protein